MKKVNVALIGVSGFAHHHYQEILRWNATGRVNLVAATIINQDEEAQKVETLRGLSCGIFSDYREMLAKLGGRIDLCVIPTGIPYHTEMTLAALDAGCNVLLEKPAAATVQEIDEMKAAAEKAGKLIAIGFQHMYVPEVAAMKRAILDGLLGEVQCIKCMGLWPRPQSYYERNNWAGRLQLRSHWVLDSPFNNAFAHWLNVLCFLAGPEFGKSAAPASIEAELYRAYRIESTDTSCMRVQSETGIPLYIWLTHCCAKADLTEPVLEIRGEKGSLVWTNESKVVLRQGGKETDFARVSTFPECRADIYAAVLDKLDGGDSFFCDLGIARNHTLCVNGAFEAAEIHSIASRFHHTEALPGDSLAVIDGIKETFQKAFDQEKLLGEIGVPWASKAGCADLRGYSGFKGVKSVCR